MKTDELMVLALAGVAAWMIVRAARPATAAQSSPVAGYVNEIFGPNNTAFGNGWRYFDDGTAIGPDGRYYFNGQPVWAPW